MSKRVSPTERIRAEIDELFSSERELAEVLEEVGRVATRLLMQAAIGAEVTEFLGRQPQDGKAHQGIREEGFSRGRILAPRSRGRPAAVARLWQTPAPCPRRTSSSASWRESRTVRLRPCRLSAPG